MLTVHAGGRVDDLSFSQSDDDTLVLGIEQRGVSAFNMHTGTHLRDYYQGGPHTHIYGLSCGRGECTRQSLNLSLIHFVLGRCFC